MSLDRYPLRRSSNVVSITHPRWGHDLLPPLVTPGLVRLVSVGTLGDLLPLLNVHLLVAGGAVEVPRLLRLLAGFRTHVSAPSARRIQYDLGPARLASVERGVCVESRSGADSPATPSTAGGASEDSAGALIPGRKRALAGSTWWLPQEEVSGQ